MKLLITGASGFLGRRTVLAALEAGHDVRVVVRPTTSIDHLNWPDTVDVYRADLRGGVDLRPAFEGVDALIHLAAGVTGTDEQQFQSTVAGTERLLAAMAESDTRRLVLASSFYVYEWSGFKRTLTEQTPMVADPYSRDGYTTAKVWQERVTRRMADEQGWELCVLRPGFIWGPGNEWSMRAGQPVGRLLAVVGPLSDAAVTHVDNCAGYFVKAVESDVAIGQTLNVFDGQRTSNWQIAGAFARAQGPKLRRLPIPYSAGLLTTWTAKAVSRVLFGKGGKLPSLLVPNLYQARFRPLKFPPDRLRSVLGLPQYSFAECVQRTWRPVGSNTIIDNSLRNDESRSQLTGSSV